ncbi:hypothetical protein DENSPDRAFT_842206 [Dentipellis sp. KUC8613]|nr:hypothetical protein DENSPDRAFT_842206 [Dentipellis sp. KUC8613]
MARPVVSYDDIAAHNPPTAGPSVAIGTQMLPPAFASTSRAQGGPPNKKRKRNNFVYNGNTYNNGNGFNNGGGYNNHNHHQQNNWYGNNRGNYHNYRGRGGGPGANAGRKYVQHWDDPGSAAPAMSYGGDEEEGVTTTILLQDDESYDNEDGELGDEGAAAEEGEESRELTHEDIWDDSALIDAWESATAEYEAFHGKGKSWKNEPVKKSPLWYNIPPPPSKLKTTQEPKASGLAAVIAEAVAEAETSQPLDFDTFVPQHDASLALPAEPNGLVSEAQLAEVPAGWPSQDEAFSRAMSAMYWSGYWTAVYHSHQKLGKKASTSADEQGEDAAGEGEYAADADESMNAPADEEKDLVSTQR